MWTKIKSFLFKNTTDKQTVAKNTVWLTISNFGGRLLKAIVVIYAARVLGTTDYGLFSYAMTLAGFFTLFVDPGVNAMVMREIPKSNDTDRRHILSTTLVIKIFLVGISGLFIFFVAPYFSTLPGAKALLPIAACIVVFDSFREFFSSFIRARERMEWEAAIFLTTNAVIVVAGFLFLWYSKTAVAFGWSYVPGVLVGAILGGYILRDYLKNIFSYFSLKLIKPIVTSAWPFAVTGGLGFLLTNADVLIISWLKTASDVGIYGAAIRIIQIFYLVPMIFQFSTLPLLARLAANRDTEKFRNALERVVSVIFVASIPLAIGGFVVGTEVMRLVFGAAYASGGLSLKILMLTMLVDFPAAVISNAIFAYDHQKSLIVASAIGGVGNVILDIALIPHFGIAGSAIATLIAQIASNAYLWSAMKKINYFEVLPKLGKVALAGILMGLASFALLAIHTEIIVNILISTVIYFGLLVLFREHLLKDIAVTVGLKSS